MVWILYLPLHTVGMGDLELVLLVIITSKTSIWAWRPPPKLAYEHGGLSTHCVLALMHYFYVHYPRNG